MATHTHISISASNKFLAADGLLNLDAALATQKKIADYVKAKAKKEGEEYKPELIYVINRKTKPVKYSAKQEKAGDFKYMSKRAFKVAERKRIKPEALARVAILLEVYPKGVLTAALANDAKTLTAAIKSHLKKIEGVKAKVQKGRTKIRESNAKVFDKSAALITKILKDGGLKDTSIVESITTFGKTLIVKLGQDNYVSISGSDATKFNAARKALKGTE